MDLFRRGKFQGCLDYTRSCLTRTGVSVCQELRLKNDVLVCQYMLGNVKAKAASKDFMELLRKTASLPPSIEVNNLEITLLYNYVYSEILMLRNVEQTRETTLYTTAARVLYRVYSVLQPLCCSKLRADLPCEPKTCCHLLIQRCLDSLALNIDCPVLQPLCNVICLLAVLELKGNNYEHGVELLLSAVTAVENSYMEKQMANTSGLMIPLCLGDSSETESTSPTDWLCFLLAVSYFATKQWNKSRDILQKVREEWFTPYVTYLSGLCLMKEENYTEAVVVVGKALKKCAALPARLKAKLFNLLGDCFRKLDKPQLSIQMYRDALSLDFGYLLPLYNISLQYKKLGTTAVELECLNLLVTSLESETSSKSAEEHSVRADSLISLLQLVNTEDDNISYPAAVYRLASRCLQVERYDIASQKYQELIAYITDITEAPYSTKVQSSWSVGLPPLLQLFHEAIQSLLHAENLKECLTLCDKVINSYKSKQGDTLYNNHNISTRSSDCLQRVNGVSSQDHDNTLNTSDVKNSNANENNIASVKGTDGEIARSMKRKRSDSETSTPVTVSRRNDLSGQNVSLRNDLIGQDVSGDSTRGSCVGGEFRQLECLDCDVVALKCKAEVLVKMGELTDALECLESAVSSTLSHRKTSLHRQTEVIDGRSTSNDQPAPKRQKIDHDEARSQALKQGEKQSLDPLTDFEAGLYQSLGTILRGQRQYSDALHYYRLAAQLQPESTEIHYHCVEMLFSMNCPKIACANWLRHRSLSHLSSVQQVKEESDTKRQILRSECYQDDERRYIDMDIRCLQQQGALMREQPTAYHTNSLSGKTKLLRQEKHLQTK